MGQGTHSSATEDVELTSNSSQKENSEDMSTYKKFAKHKKIAKLLNDPKFCEVINDYLIHYQDTEMSNSLLFWNNLTKLKEIPVSISSEKSIDLLIGTTDVGE